MRALVLGLCASRVALAARSVFVLDQAWRFNATSEQQPPAGPCASAGCSASTDDHAWRLLDLPHDFVVEGNFSQQADASHGFLPYGCAWYRKTFTLPPATAGATFWLDLDGVATQSVVYLNGVYLGSHASGYTAQRYFLNASSPLRTSGSNLLAVFVDGTKPDGWCVTVAPALPVWIGQSHYMSH